MDVNNFLDDLDELADEEPEIIEPTRALLDRTNPMENYSDEKFWSRYKLSKESARGLIAMLEPDLRTRNRQLFVPPTLQVGMINILCMQNEPNNKSQLHVRITPTNILAMTRKKCFA
jgi:hypothetical protein